MSDIIEGIGTATQGGLFARALEPASGAKKRHPDQPDECANCGTKLEGAYCHACGQQAHLHRSLQGVIHDVMHGALHLDGKMWRTLPMLMVRPGRLTRRYIDGARARFVSPMALFLFSVFLMFAVFQVLGIGVGSSPTQDDSIAQISEGVEQATADAKARVEQLETEESYTVLVSDEVGSANLKLNPTGIAWLDEGVTKKWRDNPSLMLYKLQANAYKFSWFLIPISLPFMWLLFVWKRRFKIYDHAIFVTYSLSFMTLMFVILSLAGAAGITAGWLFTIFATIAPLHIYKHMKGAYELSRFSATWRLVALIICITMILVIFLQALFVLGLF